MSSVVRRLFTQRLNVRFDSVGDRINLVTVFVLIKDYIAIRAHSEDATVAGCEHKTAYDSGRIHIPR